jgi:homoserine O-acetyltransferase
LSSVGIVETKYYTFAHHPKELVLDSGQRLGPVTLAYETYGTLNSEKSNAILIFHALSGDAHAAGKHHPNDAKPGWWDSMIGPGKAFDTDRYFVICANTIGGCRGSTGPSSTNPGTGRPYGLDFPVFTIRDIVRSQRALIDHLGIDRLLAVAGASMAGMETLEWAITYPNRVKLSIPIATASAQSAQNIAFNEMGRRAIMADPRWKKGDYYGKESPLDGLAVARMIGHVTYVSDATLTSKFGRKLENGDGYGFSLDPEFQVESYLKNKGETFTRRFDANSYLYITRAIDYFDLSKEYGTLDNAIGRAESRFLLLSFTSDWLYPPSKSEEILSALRRCRKHGAHEVIDSTFGHDAFLIEDAKITPAISRALEEAHCSMSSLG